MKKQVAALDKNYFVNTEVAISFYETLAQDDIHQKSCLVWQKKLMVSSRPY